MPGGYDALYLRLPAVSYRHRRFYFAIHRLQSAHLHSRCVVLRADLEILVYQPQYGNPMYGLVQGGLAFVSPKSFSI